ncbi:MAG: dihydroxyacetone kinase subunit L [Firmicutes bacterium]|nr:dihydroxyacetone kinase subunit L [Candidatus Colivicinus equi]
MINNKKVIEILHNISLKINEQKDYLTMLDNEIGDGDHGINLARGFVEVDKKLESISDKDIGTILKTTGMTLVSTVGGASGPLYGTAFMYAGKQVGDKSEIDINDFKDILKVAIDGVKVRGKAEQGEKTMLDAMIPAYNSMSEEQDAKVALLKGVDAAKKGVEYTKTIIATKGRASYLGERSLGHQDPGATSFTFMLEVIAESL